MNIHFTKEQLSDFDFSLNREILLANSKAAYCSTSLIGCNTRKYHGLLVAPQILMDGRYVMLSSLDETVVQGENTTKLGTHKYPGTLYPAGYNYLENFSYGRNPEWIFKINDIVLKKEIVLVKDEERVLIKYSVVEAEKPFQLWLEPFLAFRNVHELTKSNLWVNKKFEKIDNGIKFGLYSGFSHLSLQFSRKVDYVPVPDWFYNMEYPREQERGYDFHEDLYRPGYFKLKVSKGDTVIVSAGLEEISPRKLSPLFNKEVKNPEYSGPLNSMDNCLKNAAQQFLVSTAKGASIVAGFPWFGEWGRDTFIALPGLTLSAGNPEMFTLVMEEMMEKLKNGLFPNTGSGDKMAYNSADAPLWFFWALQQAANSYTLLTISSVWEKYGVKMKTIIENYRKGTLYNIHTQENGLLFAGEKGFAVTWMDAVVNGKPVTPRTGCTVELNALWYNAICFALECAKTANDAKFISEWEALPEQIEFAFRQEFWDPERGYLADYVNGTHKDWSLRPNQVIAASLPYSPADYEMKKALLDAVKEKLLTPRGLRTLSPDDKEYKGVYAGDHASRDLAYHQGTVWTWLLGHFAEAYLKIHGEEGKVFVQELYDNFLPALTEYGIGTIAEIYDGDAPHKAKGAISQAWSVAELLRIRDMLQGKYAIKSSYKKEIDELITV